MGDHGPRISGGGREGKIYMKIHIVRSLSKNHPNSLVLVL